MTCVLNLSLFLTSRPISENMPAVAFNPTRTMR